MGYFMVNKFFDILILGKLRNKIRSKVSDIQCIREVTTSQQTSDKIRIETVRIHPRIRVLVYFPTDFR